MSHQNHPSIALIGCGNLGRALVEGWLQAGYPASQITVTRRHTSGLADLAGKGVHVTDDNAVAVKNAAIIILAVKPYNVAPILGQLSGLLDAKRQLLVSAASGVTMAQLSEAAPGLPVARIMPNTASAIGESVTCACEKGLQPAQPEQMREVFGKLGLYLPVDEGLMEAATVLGACGVAYVMRFMRAFVQAGIQIGFDAKTATAIVNQTVRGASGLLVESGRHPEEEIDKVTTPRGCTIVGLNEMEHAGFSSSLIRGIVASFKEIEG